MSHTARTDDECTEFFDAPDILDQKVDLLCEWIKKSKHFVAFTGAGISTSCGIPDFRSGLNTVLDTGAGVWTMRAAISSDPTSDEVKKNLQKKNTKSTLKAIPSLTHMSLVELERQKLLKYLISQNTDGLHRRSGFPTNKLSELHGNSNLERCASCSKEYLRDFRVRTANGVHEHQTGRKCGVCGGVLQDTIINFGESLPQMPLLQAEVNAEEADLCLAMGSSLTVTPAADFPKAVGLKGKKHKKARLVIVNLQATPLDNVCQLRINAKTDDVMRLVISKLNLQIPEFRLRRNLSVTQKSKPLDKEGQIKVDLEVAGMDADETPFSLFRKVAVLPSLREGDSERRFSTLACVEEPFKFSFALPRAKRGEEAKNNATAQVKVDLSFARHYEEPDLALSVPITLTPDANTNHRFLLEYNPFNREWQVEQKKA